MSVPTPENFPQPDDSFGASNTADVPETDAGDSTPPTPPVEPPTPAASSAPEPEPKRDPLVKVGDPDAPDYVEPLPTQGSDDGEVLEADEIPDDIKRLLEEPNGPYSLQSGTVIVVRPLKMREFLALLRIITRGASMSMSGIDLNLGDEDGFVRNLLAMTLFAVPEAEEEVIVFVRSIIDPIGLNGNKAHDEPMLQALDVEMFNPEMEDVVNILAKVIAAEGADLHALGKRLVAMWKMATKMGLTKGITTPKTGAGS